jgi:tRNA dimethylallyltransferase
VSASPRLVVVVGPTASGKSALAMALATAAGGEIVSADSQQVYRGMDLGTAKPSAAERAAVPHHLVDVCEPTDDMTAGRFVALADRAIAEIAARGRPIVVVGGTMLYVRALLVGLAPAPPRDEALRARLAAEAAEPDGVAALHARLAALDPAAAARIDRRDARRVVRALEVAAVAGRTQSELHAEVDWRTAPPRYRARTIGLAPLDRAELYGRIDARVLAMVEAGLVAEVAGLRAQGIRPPLRSQQAIGYAELHRHLDGALDLGEAVRLIQRNSRRYARRQLSWYRADPGVEWHPAAADVDPGALVRYLRNP